MLRTASRGAGPQRSPWVNVGRGSLGGERELGRRGGGLVESGEVLVTECEVVAMYTPTDDPGARPVFSLGYGACWLTGWFAFDRDERHLFLTEDGTAFVKPGDVVKPSWLLTTTCTVPPVR